MVIFKLPESVTTEAQALACTGRARRLLVDMYNERSGNDNFELWRDGFFKSALAEINRIWGAAMNDAVAAKYPGNRPPWFDADVQHWNGMSISYPPGLNKDNPGSKQSFMARLVGKMDMPSMPDIERFALEAEIVAARKACEADTFWDSEMPWL